MCHILCQHVLYQTLANAVFSFGDIMTNTFVSIIGNAAMKPLKQALLLWSRASELSADRVACIFTPARTLSRALARMDMIPKYIIDTMNFEEWAEQGKDYEALKKGTTINKIARWMTDTDMNYPYTPVRVYEAMKWENTALCGLLRSKPFQIESFSEEKLESKGKDKPNNNGWRLQNISKNIEVDSIVSKFKGFKL